MLNKQNKTDNHSKSVESKGDTVPIVLLIVSLILIILILVCLYCNCAKRNRNKRKRLAEQSMKYSNRSDEIENELVDHENVEPVQGSTSKKLHPSKKQQSIKKTSKYEVEAHESADGQERKLSITPSETAFIAPQETSPYVIKFDSDSSFLPENLQKAPIMLIPHVEPEIPKSPRSPLGGQPNKTTRDRKKK